jgi:hypothetical protein
MQGNALSARILGAARTLLDGPGSASPMTIILRLMPQWLTPHAATAMSRLGWAERYELARDTIYAFADCLACNYCAARPADVQWKTTPGVARRGGAQLDIPADMTPSVNSVLAALLQARNKSVLPGLRPPDFRCSVIAMLNALRWHRACLNCKVSFHRIVKSSSSVSLSVIISHLSLHHSLL